MMTRATNVVLSLFLFTSLVSGKLMFPSGVSIAIAVLSLFFTASMMAIQLVKTSKRFGHMASAFERFFGGYQLEYTTTVVVASISFVGALLNWTLFFQGRHAANFFIPAVISLALVVTSVVQAFLSLRAEADSESTNKPTVMNPVVPESLKQNRALA
ncbi:hypothetical protein AAVH_18534 [Aphelenchoides avenae]|nr:hypothetical protein AAVH_18534 [Aphelenchus avenae]